MKKWEACSWAKKRKAHALKATATDFDRFQACSPSQLARRTHCPSSSAVADPGAKPCRYVVASFHLAPPRCSTGDGCPQGALR